MYIITSNLINIECILFKYDTQACFILKLSSIELTPLLNIASGEPVTIGPVVAKHFPRYLAALRATVRTKTDGSVEFIWLKYKVSEQPKRATRRRQRHGEEEEEDEEEITLDDQQEGIGELKNMVTHHQRFNNDLLHYANHYFWGDHNNWDTTEEMTHNVGGFS